MHDTEWAFMTSTVSALGLAASLRLPAPWDIGAVTVAAIFAAASVLLLRLAVAN